MLEEMNMNNIFIKTLDKNCNMILEFKNIKVKKAFLDLIMKELVIDLKKSLID